MADFLNPSPVSFFRLLIFGCSSEPLRVYHETYDQYPRTIRRVIANILQKELRWWFAVTMDVIAIRALIIMIPFLSLNAYLTALPMLPTNNLIKTDSKSKLCIFSYLNGLLYKL